MRRVISPRLLLITRLRRSQVGFQDTRIGGRFHLFSMNSLVLQKRNSLSWQYADDSNDTRCLLETISCHYGLQIIVLPYLPFISSPFFIVSFYVVEPQQRVPS